MWPLLALRTVRAVLPHTALQSLVSTSGVSRRRKGSATGEPPIRSEGALAMCSLDAVASADTRRSVQIEPSARHRSGFRQASAACLALSGTDQTLIGSISPCASNFLPPFPRDGFASHPSRRAQRQRYYEGSDSCRVHPPRQVSSLTSPCRPDIQTPTTRAARWSLSQSSQRHRLLPGFATNEQARHSSTPNQVCHPTDCRFTSGCSPPRLAATQLPSITEPTTGSGTDLHRASKAPSRGALIPAQAGIYGAMGTGLRRCDEADDPTADTCVLCP